MAKLTAMGFKLAQPEYIPGEKDWVYGVIVKGRHVMAGQRIPVEEPLVIEVGNGMRSSDENINYVDPAESEQQVGEDEIDEFDVVTAPDPSEAENKPQTPRKPSNP